MDSKLVQRQTDTASARSASRLLLLQARLRVAQLARLRIEPLAGTAQLSRRRLRDQETSYECLACGAHITGYAVGYMVQGASPRFSSNACACAAGSSHTG